MKDNTKQFFEILDGKHIYSVYQPIVSLEDGSIYGYEALSRIQIPECDINIEELFFIAEQQKRLWELEKLCRGRALQNAVGKPVGSKLFINVDANIMHDPELKVGFTRNKLREYGLDPHDIVFEVTEKSAIKTIEAFTTSIEHYRSQNFKIAVDDFGSGYSGLNRVCAFFPEFIKIDIELVRDIDKEPIKKSAVSAMTGFCKECGIKVIAEGIETDDELKALIRLGVDYGQGYYIAHPVPEFADIPSEKKLRIKEIKNSSRLNYYASVFGRIGEISRNEHTVSKNTPAISIYEKMMKEPKITEVFVTDEDNGVCGILTRSYIFERFGGQFGYNLSSRLPAERIMLNEFMAVDGNTAIDEAASAAMQRPVSRIYDAIAITDNNKYKGTVSIKELLMTAINIQVKRASDANPLTRLPGNLAIQETISNTLVKADPWTIIYIDIDNFKAYNDAYGFSNGDLMIKAVAMAMQKCCGTEDFMGHIGGDDFVIVSYEKNIEELCNNICDTFHDYICSLYSREDWEKGFIVSRNRNGFVQEFPIATLSVAAISNKSHEFNSTDELSKAIAKAKKQCKQINGNAVVVI